MTQRTYAPPLEHRPRPLVVNQTPCRTGLFLILILLGTAVLGVDRYLTNDAVRRVEDVEAWGVRETAQIIATNDAQARTVYAMRTNEVLAGQVRLLQERLDNLSQEGLKLLQENIGLRTLLGTDLFGPIPEGPVVTPITPDIET